MSGALAIMIGGLAALAWIRFRKPGRLRWPR